MYHAFYLYSVPIENIDRFLRIVSEAADVYRRYGAVVTPAMRLTDGDSKYGCVGLSELVESNPDEQLFMGFDSFRDVEQFRALMKKIDSDPDIGRLYKEIQEVIDLKKIVRWEMEEAAPPATAANCISTEIPAEHSVNPIEPR
jgi:uncharacterized protein YbaA (DUF1428 family)